MKAIAALAAAVGSLCSPVPGPQSLLTIGQQDAWRSGFDAPSVSVSDDGRWIAFASYARLVPADTNIQRDIYVLDRTTGKVTVESILPGGRLAGADNSHPSISADGKLLVYQSNLPTFSVWTESHVVMRRRADATSLVITAREDGAPVHGWAHSPVISRNGRTVAFVSFGSLLPSDNDESREDVYTYDARTRAFRHVSVDDLKSAPSATAAIAPSVSDDGRYIAFTRTSHLTSSAIYVRDTHLGATTAVAGGSAGASDRSWSASIDAAGKHVAFVSRATNLAPGDRNSAPDVFVATLQTGSIELISRSVSGGSGNGRSAVPSISANGRFVAFQSEASDLVCVKECSAAVDDINLLWDVYLYDRDTGTMARISGDETGGWLESSTGPALDGSGRVIAFSSRHPIDADDVENDFDLFVHFPRPPGGSQ